MTQHGPHLDDENRAKAAIDALAQIPPADLTAFSYDDIHGYREMTRRLCWTAIVVFSVALVCIGIALAFRPHP